jgi:hypothetical protein
MLDDLRRGLAANPPRVAPECAVCGRPIVDQDDLAFADREHANLHEACAIDISSRHIAQPPTWGLRDASNARPYLTVTGREIIADTMLADLKAVRDGLRTRSITP